MQKQLFLFFILLLQIQLSAQLGSTRIVGAKSLSMGNTGAVSQGIQAIYFGQAGLTSIDKFAVQLSTEQRFTLSDLNLASAAVAFRPVKFGVIGVFLSNYGIEEYREQKFGFSFASSLGNAVSLGAQWSYHTIRIDEYGSINYIGVDIGLLLQPNEKIALGIHVANPVKRQIVEGDYTIPIYRLGAQFNLSEKVNIITDLRHTTGIGLSFHSGLDYQLIKNVNFRIGLDTGVSSFHFGLAYNLDQGGTIDAGFSNHQYLGITPALSIGYEK